MQSSTLEQRLNHNSADYITYYIFPIHIHAFKGQVSAQSKNENKVIFIIYLKVKARYMYYYHDMKGNNKQQYTLQTVTNDCTFLSGEFRMCQMYLLLLCPGHE